MTLSFRVRARRGDFSLDVACTTRARALVVVGPSGAGKTTLLQALAGLSPGGTVHLSVAGETMVDTEAGLDPAPHRRGVGSVFQDGRLFPHMTVAGNIGFARRFAADPMDVDEALALVDLRGFGGRWPASLSGGEARRVALARTLAARPRLLLLDEPLTGLDARRREAMIAYLRRLRDETGTPMVVVTHDPRDVAALAGDVLNIEAGRAAGVPAWPVASGTPALRAQAAASMPALATSRSAWVKP